MNEKTVLQAKRWMSQALELAGQGDSKVFPNPYVGALVIQNDEVVGQGWHQFAGGPHAEVEAGKGVDLKGSTLVVTLEPCAHQGKTPPCVDFILKHGVARVIYGCPDPGPGAGGAEVLKQKGVEVIGPLITPGLFKRIEPFCKNMLEKKTYISLKWAMTLDGRIATESGDSKWITGEVARKAVHQFRTQVDGIMVGVGTVFHDEPDLGVRYDIQGPSPRPIVWDLKGKTRELQTWWQSKLDRCPVVLTTSKEQEGWMKGIEVIALDDFSDLESKLFQHGFHHVLIEGGAGLFGQCIDHQVGDQVMAWIAPKCLGGEKAKPVIAGQGALKMNQAKGLVDVEIQPLGDDCLIKGLLKVYHPQSQLLLDS